jgi:hypothetical protein
MERLVCSAWPGLLAFQYVSLLEPLSAPNASEPDADVESSIGRLGRQLRGNAGYMGVKTE